MKKFDAEIIVRLKPAIKDVKGLTLRQAIEGMVPLDYLNCRVGNFYKIEFCAEDQEAAKQNLDKIAREILSNDVIETYEIVSLKEI